MGCTPLFLNAEPHSTGTKLKVRAPARMARWMSATESSSSARYFSISSSSSVATTSSSLARHSSAWASSSVGIGTSCHSSPLPSSQTLALMVTRSMMPLKWPSAPMGSWMTAGVDSRRSSIIFTVRKKSAPMRSILLTKQMRGTRYLLAWRHTVSVWGSTPATASNTATAPSSTRSDRSTSMVKST